MTLQEIETMELCLADLKHVVCYTKGVGWYWADCDEGHGPFKTRLEAVLDAVEPYMYIDDDGVLVDAEESTELASNDGKLTAAERNR